MFTPWHACACLQVLYVYVRGHLCVTRLLYVCVCDCSLRATGRQEISQLSHQILKWGQIGLSTGLNLPIIVPNKKEKNSPSAAPRCDSPLTNQLQIVYFSMRWTHKWATADRPSVHTCTDLCMHTFVHVCKRPGRGCRVCNSALCVVPRHTYSHDACCARLKVLCLHWEWVRDCHDQCQNHYGTRFKWSSPILAIWQWPRPAYGIIWSIAL